jgi:hypothetical protein
VVGASELLITGFYMPVGESIHYWAFHKEVNPNSGEIIRSTGFNGCWYTRVPALVFLGWIPPLVVEIILCLLMLYKAWKSRKDGGKFPLLDVIVRDRYVG